MSYTKPPFVLHSVQQRGTKDDENGCIINTCFSNHKTLTFYLNFFLLDDFNWHSRSIIFYYCCTHSRQLRTAVSGTVYMWHADMEKYDNGSNVWDHSLLYITPVWSLEVKVEQYWSSNVTSRCMTIGCRKFWWRMIVEDRVSVCCYDLFDHHPKWRLWYRMRWSIFSAQVSLSKTLSATFSKTALQCRILHLCAEVVCANLPRRLCKSSYHENATDLFFFFLFAWTPLQLNVV